eukprot:9484517-Pyramimonas_sp.AAC.2
MHCTFKLPSAGLARRGCTVCIEAVGCAGHLQGKGKDVSMEIHDERSLLALQGPNAVKTVQKMTKEDLSKMYFSDFKRMDLNGIPVWITRTGYTGEDGFEISVRTLRPLLPHTLSPPPWTVDPLDCRPPGP